MSLVEDLHTQEALDEAIRLLYQSRPAKAAALLGIVDPDNPISLAPKDTEEKLSSIMSPGRLAGTNNYGYASNTMVGDVKVDRSEQVGDLNYNTGASRFNVASTTGPSQLTEPRDPMSTSIAKGDGIGKDGVSSSREGGRSSYASFDKQAMSEQDYLMYQAGLGPMMEHTGDPTLTPQQLSGLGVGTVGVAAANRMRAKNVAARELKDIRKQYLNAVTENSLTRQRLRQLNKELKVRGARPSLRLAPTAGLADAYMAKAEKDLTSSVLKNRYRGAMPLILAGLIGTVAYNKLNEV